MTKNPPTICTIAAKNYLAQVRVLAQSFHAVHPGGRVFVLLIDQVNGYFDPAQEPFELIMLDQLLIPQLPAMVARYTTRELATAVKPYLLEHLLAVRGLERVCYFDPDIYFYAPMTALWQELETSQAVVTPHLLGPLSEERLPNEFSILQAGTFNLGFIGLRNTLTIVRFLRWWQQRLVRYSHGDPARWQHFDQKWVDLLPGFIDNVRIDRYPGHNVAYWDLANRHLTKTKQTYFVNGQRLIFFHFSGYDPAQPKALSRHQNRFELGALPNLRTLCDDYRQQLYAAGYAQSSQWPYQLTSTAPTRQALARGAHKTNDYIKALGPNLYRTITQMLASVGLETTLTRLLGRRLITAVHRLFMNLQLPTHPAAGHAPTFGVNVIGYFDDPSGVGEVARRNLLALQQAGIPSASMAINSRPEVPHAGVGPYRIHLIQVNADQLPAAIGSALGSGYAIGWWWWELASFPVQWADRFPLVRELWVGSNFIKNALAPHTHLPIHVMGVPTTADQPTPLPPAAFGLSPRSFTFLFVFDFLSFIERKNPAAVVAAYRQAFGERSTTTQLVIKARNAEKFPEQAAQLHEAVRHVGGHFITETLSRPHLRALFHLSDAYVSLHRSEGFGLTIAEAMGLGKPVIATDYSGNTDYMNEGNSYPVSYTLTTLKETIGPYEAGNVWAEPDIGQAAYFMRRVVAQQREARHKSARAAREIHLRYSPMAVGRKMADRIHRLHSSEPMAS